MKISYNWLKQYLNIDLSAQIISELLTDCGLEVEAFEEISTVKGGLKGVLIGKVVHKEKHPDADKLSLTKVDIGSDKLLDIVCGAPNVAVNQKVLVATIGTVIYSADGEFTIKKSKIRGQNSEGMICAEDELGLGTSHDGIMILPEDAQIGMTASQYFNIENDIVFEIGLTPNRSDATSHLGVARDLYAVLKNKNIINPHTLIFNKNISQEHDINKGNLKIDIEIDNPEACYRYSGVTIENISVKESPDWLKNKLRAIGLKPINNIVDISNYILFDLGQPLHIFDADKIKGQKVIIKKHVEPFEFITLDGSTQKMDNTDLMICNTETPMCIAGVYGGMDSGVTYQTQNIFIESACFSPLSIRKTSKRLGLKTDSSFRFERGTDPQMTIPALLKTIKLILDNAGGHVTSDIIDLYPNPQLPYNVDFNYEKFYALVGKRIEKNIIKNILNALEINIVKEDETNLQLLVPTYRVDVTRAIDVAEEILRIYGFNNIEIPTLLNASLSYTNGIDKELMVNTASQFLSSKGYAEIMCNSLSKIEYYEKLNCFDKNTCVKILNPLSKDLEVLRQGLLFSALEVVSYNINRKVENMKLYEYGKYYKLKPDETNLEKYAEGYMLSLIQTGLKQNESWLKDTNTYDFYSLKADVFILLKRLGVNIDKCKSVPTEMPFFEYGLDLSYNNVTLVSLGLVKDEVLKYFDIKQNVFYAEINWNYLLNVINNFSFTYKEPSKYPSMRRDLSLMIDAHISFADIEALAKKQNINILKKINLFDIYQGKGIEDGKKSYAVSFMFQDENKTLTDTEIDGLMKKLITVYENTLKAVIR